MENRIKKVMASVLDINEKHIDKKTNPDNVKNWDSLAHMNLVVALEEEFGVQFTQQEIVEMVSYPLIKLIIDQKIKQADR